MTMSSVRGPSNLGGRGRGSAPAGAIRGRGRGRGTSQSRGGIFDGNASSQRGGNTTGGVFAQAARGNPNHRARGQHDAHGNTFAQTRQPKNASFGGAQTKGNWQERYQANDTQQLTKARERERADAIERGIIADPDKPRALSEAITPVGTCQDLCAEYERVERVVQKDVWTEELNPELSVYARNDKEPDEARMVKKFRRAAAGLEEQLPSDLRPPHVLKRTCDYLFDEVIGNAPSLAKVHHFVWDRTRAIRNDFSIQQLTKASELSIAVECYERIARFHIVSLHQLALPERPYSKYDGQQEREQLDRTLLSLMQYYDDCRGRINLPNEAEFRAYCVLFQLQNPTPDLEERVQNWPGEILRDNRVQRALDVYMAACNVMDAQGPLRPRANHLIAQQDWQRFWRLVESSQVSYLMACVAEIYFNLVRRTVINALFKAFRANTTNPTPEWTIDELLNVLAFDEEEEVFTYCERFGFSFKEREDGEQYLDLSTVPGRTLPDPNAGMVKQAKSRIVENKRCGRTLPAVIDGLTVRQARDAGLVMEEEDDEGMEDVQDDGAQTADSNAANGDGDDGESLFLPQKEEQPPPPAAEETSPLSNGFGSQAAAQANVPAFSWGKPSNTKASPFGTAQPTTSPFAAPAASPFAAPATQKPSFNFLSGNAGSAQNAAASKPKFDFSSAVSKLAQPTDTNGTLESGSSSVLGTGPTSESSKSGKLPTGFGFASGISSGGFGAATRNGTSKAFEVPKDNVAHTPGTSSAPPQESSPFAKAPAPTFAPPNAPSPFAFPSVSRDQSESSKASDKTPSLFSPKPAEPSNYKAPAIEAGSPTEPVFAPVKPETAPSLPIQPTETKPAQPHFTASPTPAAPPSPPSASPSPSSLNTGFRRPSTSTDTKPKKPSPLSHSFTATEDNGGATPGQQESLTAPKPIPNERQTAVAPKAATTAAPETSTARREELIKPTPFQRPTSQVKDPVESFDATIDRVSKELVEDDFNGYLKQFVEYKVSQTITRVQEELAAERRAIRLSELRVLAISRKFLKRWISIAWQRRTAIAGRERRQRRRRRLEEGFDDGSLRDDESLVGSSRPDSVAGSNVSRKDHRQTVDAMFQRTMNSKPPSQPTTRNDQARAGSKRPASSHGERAPQPTRESGHKRMKSTSHVDDRGRIKKPTPTSNPNADLLKRSSFLGFSTSASSPPSRNTTKSNYFRLKALGIHRADELSMPRGTKRTRTESSQPFQSSPPALRRSTSAASSPDETTTKALMPPPSSTSSRASRANEEDEALFARIRAAREGLTESSSLMKSATAREGEFQRSLSASQSSNESPSMLRARAEARARVSGAGSPGRDVPAYRLRESRFVPREQYGKAIERAKEMRASRSRETSRPASRIEYGTPSQAPDFSVTSAADQQQQPPQVNGLPNPKSPAKPAEFNSAPLSRHFRPLTSQAPLDFANHTTELDHSNPFLPATVPESSQPVLDARPTFGSQSRFGQQPVPDARPTFGSQPAFGQQSVPSFATPSTFGLPSAYPPQYAPRAPVTVETSRPQATFESQATPHAAPVFGTLQSESPFDPQPMSTNHQDQPNHSLPFDQTVQLDMIDQSLASSFGRNEDNHFHPFQMLDPDLVGLQPQQSQEDGGPPQQSSYMHTDTISLVSSDEDEDPTLEAPNGEPPYANGFRHEEGTESPFGETTEEENPEPFYEHANPYAILANHNQFQDEGSLQSSAEDEEAYDYGHHQQDTITNGFEHPPSHESWSGIEEPEDYYPDEEGMDGDIDEATEFDDEEDEAGLDPESTDDDYAETDPRIMREHWQRVREHDERLAQLPRPPTPNPELMKVGNTEDAPIELDSD